METHVKIQVKGNPFVINLKSELRGSQVFVVTDKFRHEKCTSENLIKHANPLTNIFAASPNLFAGEQHLTLREEFVNDIAYQVNSINASPEPPSSQVFFDACCFACNQHIARCGRLFIADMFTYLDIFAILLNTYFRQTEQQTKEMYLACTKVLGHSLNAYIKCPGQYGVMMDFDTWARKNDL